MPAKGNKPKTTKKATGKGPDTKGIKLDQAGRFKVKEGELSDEQLDRVSGGTIFNMPNACKKPKTPTTPILKVCCPSVNMCKPKP